MSGIDTALCGKSKNQIGKTNKERLVQLMGSPEACLYRVFGKTDDF